VLVGPRRATVVGTSGEGYETTFQVFRHGGFIDPHRRRCWFNPHLPVGSSHDTVSVEESVRLVGSIVESLRHELAAAAAVGGDAYEVRLEASATRPRDDFNDTGRRVWGDRELLTRVAGPIRVTVGGSPAIASLELRLRNYRPEAQFGHPNPERASIRATLAPTDRRLRLRPPRCQALE
jgi:hypothetical protein